MPCLSESFALPFAKASGVELLQARRVVELKSQGIDPAGRSGGVNVPRYIVSRFSFFTPLLLNAPAEIDLSRESVYSPHSFEFSFDTNRIRPACLAYEISP